MTPFAQVDDLEDIAHLPDGTLISWRPIADDPTSQACAYVRRMPASATAGDFGQIDERAFTVWISPGNGWEPESLDVLVLPVTVILLGSTAVIGDFIPEAPVADPWPEQQLVTDFGTQTLLSGGTYPRDVALQAAATIWADAASVRPDDVIDMARAFEVYLNEPPVSQAGTEQSPADLLQVPGDRDKPGYFSAGWGQQ